jgi:signal transduction histidine kinase
MAPFASIGIDSGRRCRGCQHDGGGRSGAGGYTVHVRGKQGFGLKHLVIFVVVAVVLNAQYTWWVVESLRENSERLGLERALILSQAEAAALTVAIRLDKATSRIVELPAGVIPPSGDPFPEVRVVLRADTRAGWIEDDGRPSFCWPIGGGRAALLYLDPESPRRWLAVAAPSMRLVEAGGSTALPRVPLARPLDRFAVAPDPQRWNDVMVRYRRRVVLVVLEGTFFLAAMVSAVFLLWVALRREGERERQHQNFVSAITHELKTPLAGIRVALETVLRGRADPDGTRRFLTNAVTDADRLSDLIEKVLEVTRYTGGGHRLQIALGDLSQLVEEEVMAAERRGAARGVAIEADIAPGLQASFDPEALAIVVSNLVENAVKYAQGDDPRVTVRLAIEHGEAVLEVSDTGIGIAPGELETIFRPFYRANDEITRRTPGTGIGLFVAREIAVAHGGRLTASSAGKGQGATFRLALPGAGILPEDDFSE